MTDTSPERAKAYQKKRQFLRLFDLVFTPATLLVTVCFPVSLFLKSLAIQVTGQPYGNLAVYFLLYSVYMMLLDGPLSFYSGYLVEKEFGLSKFYYVD